MAAAAANLAGHRTIITTLLPPSRNLLREREQPESRPHHLQQQREPPRARITHHRRRSNQIQIHHQHHRNSSFTLETAPQHHHCTCNVHPATPSPSATMEACFPTTIAH
ncbi:hypothetical protein DEO72_LG6g1254 [Vigna unguiculata]|uniref:Uncharacterized protein n=1 Tax=Vigna unguiculata TaxID=3917 RepID=A0A4D6M7J8_VIGUN|nr:hypothetical protein DEO72_LG6g1254 [Vigna unguiculata]